MAIIPNATRMTRALPSGQQAVVRPDLSNADLGAGALGEAAVSISGDAKKLEMIDRQAKLDSADVTMSVALEKGGRAFDDRTDHTNFTEEYDKDSNEAMGIAGENLDPRDREAWADNQRPKIERMRTRVLGVQRVKLRDEARASYTGQLRDAREAALTGDMGETGELIENLTESMVLQGFMDREEGEGAVAGFKEDAAIGRLRMMNPTDRLTALDQPWAENLPSDKRAVLKREAEVEAFKLKAVATVDAIPKDATREEGQAIIDAIEDPKERMAAESRYNTEYAAKTAAETEERLDLYNDLDLKIRDKDSGFKFSDIPPEELAQLNPAMRENLRASEIQKYKPRTVSDRPTFNAATRLSANQHWGALDQFLADNGSNLSDSDIKMFQKAAEEKQAPTVASIQKVIDGTLTGTDKSELRKSMLLRMNTWRDQWVRSVGSEPKQDDIQKEILRRTKDLVNAKGQNKWWSDLEPIHSFDVDADQRAALLDQVTRTEMEGENPGAYKDLGSYMTGQGMDPRDRFLAQTVWQNQKDKYYYTNSKEPRVVAQAEAVDSIFKGRGNANPSNEEWLFELSGLKAYLAKEGETDAPQ